MSYIKREPLLQIAKELQGQVFGAPLIVRAIEEAPEENVVEVVRCKDCKRCDHCYPIKNKGEEAREGYYCDYNKRFVSPSDYCIYGERRTENE